MIPKFHRAGNKRSRLEPNNRSSSRGPLTASLAILNQNSHAQESADSGTGTACAQLRAEGGRFRFEYEPGAEAAAPAARKIFIDAITAMSSDDARRILAGAATARHQLLQGQDLRGSGGVHTSGAVQVKAMRRIRT